MEEVLYQMEIPGRDHKTLERQTQTDFGDFKIATRWRQRQKSNVVFRLLTFNFEFEEADGSKLVLISWSWLLGSESAVDKTLSDVPVGWGENSLKESIFFQTNYFTAVSCFGRVAQSPNERCAEVFLESTKSKTEVWMHTLRNYNPISDFHSKTYIRNTANASNWLCYVDDILPRARLSSLKFKSWNSPFLAPCSLDCTSWHSGWPKGKLVSHIISPILAETISLFDIPRPSFWWS